MKKNLKILAVALLLTGLTVFAAPAKQRVQEIRPSSPEISAGLKPIIAEYRSGNYTQSMLDLEDLVKKEPNNTYAIYYLALTYTQLGKKEKAEACYKKVIELNSNMSLRYYSQKALACIGDATSDQCKNIKSTNKEDMVAKKQDGDNKEEDDDMTKFIKSGKMIHPAAADAITRERMERKLQAEEYLRNQQKNNEGERESSLIPTNDEIMAAYDVLKRAGLNPFETDNSIRELAYDNNSTDFLLNNLNNSNEDIQIMLLNQLLQSQNSLNYGI